jgi:hypothetical protein
LIEHEENRDPGTVTMSARGGGGKSAQSKFVSLERHKLSQRFDTRQILLAKFVERNETVEGDGRRDEIDTENVQASEPGRIRGFAIYICVCLEESVAKLGDLREERNDSLSALAITATRAVIGLMITSWRTLHFNVGRKCGFVGRKLA